MEKPHRGFLIFINDLRNNYIIIRNERLLINAYRFGNVFKSNGEQYK